jgi:hypothetical protein
MAHGRIKLRLFGIGEAMRKLHLSALSKLTS